LWVGKHYGAALSAMAIQSGDNSHAATGATASAFLLIDGAKTNSFLPEASKQ